MTRGLKYTDHMQLFKLDVFLLISHFLSSTTPLSIVKDVRIQDAGDITPKMECPFSSPVEFLVDLISNGP